MRATRQKPLSSSSNQGGLTLLEVVVGLAILALIALSVVAVMGTTLRADSANRDREAVRVTMRSQMEGVLAWQDYDSLRANFDGTRFNVGSLVSPSGESQAGQITVDSTNPDLLRVTILFSWSAPYGSDTMELSTLISRPEGTVALPRG